jgi:hypothetical protein
MNHKRGFRPEVALKSAVLVALVVAQCSCGVIKKKSSDETSDLVLRSQDMSPETADKLLSEVGGNFAYGPGLGDAAVSIGTVVVFPPFAVYLLGNAVLSLSGYEPVTVSSLLPEKDGKQWSETYDTVVSAPGKMVAAMAGHEYRSREVAAERIRAVLQRGDDSTPSVEKTS